MQYFTQDPQASTVCGEVSASAIALLCDLAGPRYQSRTKPSCSRNTLLASPRLRPDGSGGKACRSPIHSWSSGGYNVRIRPGSRRHRFKEEVGRRSASSTLQDGPCIIVATVLAGLVIPLPPTCGDT